MDTPYSRYPLVLGYLLHHRFRVSMVHTDPFFSRRSTNHSNLKMASRVLDAQRQGDQGPRYPSWAPGLKGNQKFRKPVRQRHTHTHTSCEGYTTGKQTKKMVETPGKTSGCCSKQESEQRRTLGNGKVESSGSYILSHTQAVTHFVTLVSTDRFFCDCSRSVFPPNITLRPYRYGLAKISPFFAARKVEQNQTKHANNEDMRAFCKEPSQGEILIRGICAPTPNTNACFRVFWKTDRLSRKNTPFFGKG